MTVKRVSPQEAEQLVQNENYVYVDVRSIPEFEAGHPAGAYNVPIMHKTDRGMEPNPDFLPVMEAAFEKSAKLVVGCRSGGRSLRAAEILVQAGYEDVIDQRAGMAGARDPFGQLLEAGWEAAGLAMSSDPEPARDYAALASRKGG